MDATYEFKAVEAAAQKFWNDPRVLTISVHETGTVLFPGTGFPRDLGGPDAQGCAVNIALPPGVGDAAWLRAVHAVVPALVRAFDPQILITQHGLPSAYLVDVETYLLMQQRLSVLEGIARGEQAVAEGRVATHAQAKTRLARWLK